MPNENGSKDLEQQQNGLGGDKEQGKIPQNSIEAVKSDLEKTEGQEKTAKVDNAKQDSTVSDDNKKEKPAVSSDQNSIGQEQKRIDESSLKDTTMREKLGIIKDELNVEKSVKQTSSKEKKGLEKSTIKDVAESDDEGGIRYKPPEPSKREKAFQELQSEVKQTVVDIHKKLLGLKDKLGITGIAQAVIKAGELSNALNDTLSLIRWNPKNTLIYAVEFGKGLNRLQNFSKSLGQIMESADLISKNEALKKASVDKSGKEKSDSKTAKK